MQSIRKLAESIKYKVEFQLRLSNEPVGLLETDTLQLTRLISRGYAVDDNVEMLLERYKTIHSLPEKKRLTKEQKQTLKH